MHSHAANPFAEIISDDRLRVYFSSRDNTNRSHITFVELNPKDNFRVIRISEAPILRPGEPGLFDDSGTAMGYMLTVGKKKYLYYLGWNLKVTVPWLNTIGLAIGDNSGDEFVKHGRVPIMDRSEEDPFTISYPSILVENGVFRMWYGSNLRWGKDETTMNHVIKYAESAEGITWKRSALCVVDLIHEGEYALSKPFVIRDDDKYRMWYSYRGRGNIRTYRIGYAESPDGLAWTRMDDKVGIDVSPEGWDSEMICYPCIFDYGGGRYMLYNGNGYGRTGFGIAVLEQSV
jgi:hypothetical protein